MGTNITITIKWEKNNFVNRTKSPLNCHKIFILMRRTPLLLHAERQIQGCKQRYLKPRGHPPPPTHPTHLSLSSTTASNEHLMEGLRPSNLGQTTRRRRPTLPCLSLALCTVVSRLFPPPPASLSFNLSLLLSAPPTLSLPPSTFFPSPFLPASPSTSAVPPILVIDLY